MALTRPLFTLGLSLSVFAAWQSIPLGVTSELDLLGRITSIQAGQNLDSSLIEDSRLAAQMLVERLRLNELAKQGADSYPASGPFANEAKIQMNFQIPTGDKTGKWIESLRLKGFLNYHESKTTGGINSPAWRATQEDQLVDLTLEETSAGDSLRPKYGIVLPEKPEDYSLWTEGSKQYIPQQRYGGWVVVFKNLVKYRTTFTPVDSLLRWGRVAQTLDSVESGPIRGYDGEYLEAQIWGEIDLADVDYFLVPEDATAAEIKMMKQLGLPMYESQFRLLGKYRAVVPGKQISAGIPSLLKRAQEITSEREKAHAWVHARATKLPIPKADSMVQQILKLPVPGVSNELQTVIRQRNYIRDDIANRDKSYRQVLDLLLKEGFIADLGGLDSKRLLRLLDFAEPRVVESVVVEIIKRPALLKDRELMLRLVAIKGVTSSWLYYQIGDRIEHLEYPFDRLTSSDDFGNAPNAILVLEEMYRSRSMFLRRMSWEVILKNRGLVGKWTELEPLIRRLVRDKLLVEDAHGARKRLLIEISSQLQHGGYKTRPQDEVDRIQGYLGKIADIVKEFPVEAASCDAQLTR